MNNHESGGLRGDPYADGLGLMEIAKRTGLSRAGVRSVLDRAIKKMRQYMKEHPETEKKIKELLTRPELNGKIVYRKSGRLTPPED